MNGLPSAVMGACSGEISAAFTAGALTLDESAAVATWLRDNGWAGARKLVGGYAEWIEHDEPVAVPQPPPGGRYHIGTMVERRAGGRGWVQGVAEGPRYTLLMEGGTIVVPVGEDDLVP